MFVRHAFAWLQCAARTNQSQNRNRNQPEPEGSGKAQLTIRLSPSPPASSHDSQPQQSRSIENFPNPNTYTKLQSVGCQPGDRSSTSTTNTYDSNSTQSSYPGSFQSSGLYGAFSNRSSIATTNTSLSSSECEIPFHEPKHDSESGVWYGKLRVIPCHVDHGTWFWADNDFVTCDGCGFSRWHSLMVHAGLMTIGQFIAAMVSLKNDPMYDFAGNSPLAYLASSRVDISYFPQLYQYTIDFSQNVFGQNPLHVLDPLCLGESLISFLEWFKSNTSLSLFTQRDINGHTPLLTILQCPLERSLYRKILDVFPCPTLQLLSRDVNGRNAIKLMSDASRRMREKSHVGYVKIQAGITDIKLSLSQVGQHQVGSPNQYYFHHIARGGRGDWESGFFRCRACNGSGHNDSYLDQVKCTMKQAVEWNGPDDTGYTPAHAFVCLERFHHDGTPETAAETAAILKELIPVSYVDRREMIHIRDPDGNSLVYNAAIRGLDECLNHLLQLEDESRRRAMVNTRTRNPDGSRGKSVLEAVESALEDVTCELKATGANQDSARYLLAKRGGLIRVKDLLLANQGVRQPSEKDEWRIR